MQTAGAKRPVRSLGKNSERALFNVAAMSRMPFLLGGWGSRSTRHNVGRGTQDFPRRISQHLIPIDLSERQMFDGGDLSPLIGISNGKSASLQRLIVHR